MTCDVVKLTTKLGRIGVKMSMTSGLVSGTADCGLGLRVACNAFNLADTTCDKAILNTKLVVSDVESALIVG